MQRNKNARHSFHFPGFSYGVRLKYTVKRQIVCWLESSFKVTWFNQVDQDESAHAAVYFKTYYSKSVEC